MLILHWIILFARPDLRRSTNSSIICVPHTRIHSHMDACVRLGVLMQAWIALAVSAAGLLYTGSASAQTSASTRIIQTFAGTEFTFQSDGQPAVNAPLGSLQDVTTDSSGNLYIADLYYRVFRVTPDGTVHVLAGNGFDGNSQVLFGNGSDGVPAPNTQLPWMRAIAVSPDGSVYIGGSGVIQKVSLDGILTVVATSIPGSPPLSPNGMVFDAAGNLFVSSGNRVLKIDTAGIVTTVAGNGQSCSFPCSAGDGGPATSATLVGPRGLRFDSAGNLYIADYSGGNIRKVTPQGGISSFASVDVPAGLDFDSTGNLYVTDSQGGRIFKFSSDGKTRTTIAGNSGTGFAGDGGPAIDAKLNAPLGLKVDSAGNILVADSNNQRIRRITPAGIISTVAGNGLFRVSPDGNLATLSFFQNPYAVAVSPSGLVHIADSSAATVYRVEADGTRTRVAGIGTSVVNVSLIAQPAKTSGLSSPYSIAFDRSGNLFISEAAYGLIRRVTPDGVMTTYAGLGSADPGDGGQAVNARLSSPKGLYVDAGGNLFFTEGKARIRKVTPAGIITTVAGTGVDGYKDGPSAQAQFSGLSGITMDGAGNLYVAEDPGRVRKIAPDGTVSTFAQGSFGVGSFRPVALAFDASGGLLYTDQSGSVVRRLSTDGSSLSLVAGTEGQAKFAGDGGPAGSAFLNLPTSVALDAAGNIYIADSGNVRVRVIPAGIPILSAAPQTLSFTGNSNAASPTPQLIAVTSSTVGLPFAITTSGAFLSVSSNSGSTPATVNVTASLAGLAPGSYQGAVTFTPASGAPVSAAVNLTVEAALPSKLTGDITNLSFSFVRGGAPVGKRVLVTNAGEAQVFTATAATNTGGNWLSVSPSQATATGAAPVSLTVTADPAGLQPGAYAGSVTLSNPGITDIVIPVNMTVSNSGQLIQLSQRGLTFLSVVSGGTTPPQTISVIGTGQVSSPFTAKAIVPAGIPAWLSVTPSSGAATPGQPAPTLTVTANPAGLAPGDYYGRIQVASPTADNSPREATIFLSVLTDVSDPGILVQPSGLVFTGVAGGADPPSQSVTLSSLTPGSVSFGSAVATLDGGRYIQYQPSSASFQTGSFQLVVQPNFAGLAAGIYRGAVALVFSNGSVRTVAILIVIAPAGTIQGSARYAETNGTLEVTGCTPTQLLPVITSLGTGFNVPAAFPTALVARVVDDCGTPHTEGTVVSSFSNGDVPLTMLSLGDGGWSATWQSSKASQATTTITTIAENPRLRLKGEIKLPGGLTGNASPPIVGGVGAASFAPLAPLAPGGMVTVYGAQLSNGSAPAARLPLDTLLAGTEVIVGGRSAPLLFSSDGQVNAILPYATPMNTPVQMIVARGDQYSLPVDVLMGTAVPGIFSTAGNGQGQGHIYVAGADGSLTLAGSANPAKVGDTLVMYCSGLGPLDSAVTDGGAAPLDRLVNTLNPVSVQIGSVTVPATFAGLSPGFAVGLYQVNVVVPPGVAAGDNVPVVLSVAGQSSPAVTMVVR